MKVNNVSNLQVRWVAEVTEVVGVRCECGCGQWRISEVSRWRAQAKWRCALDGTYLRVKGWLGVFFAGSLEGVEHDGCGSGGGRDRDEPSLEVEKQGRSGGRWRRGRRLEMRAEAGHPARTD